MYNSLHNSLAHTMRNHPVVLLVCLFLVTECVRAAPVPERCKRCYPLIDCTCIVGCRVPRLEIRNDVYGAAYDQMVYITQGIECPVTSPGCSVEIHDAKVKYILGIKGSELRHRLSSRQLQIELRNSIESSNTTIEEVDYACSHGVWNVNPGEIVYTGWVPYAGVIDSTVSYDSYKLFAVMLKEIATGVGYL